MNIWNIVWMTIGYCLDNHALGPGMFAQQVRNHALPWPNAQTKRLEATQAVEEIGRNIWNMP